MMEEKMPAASKYKSINFIVGYNKSDSTFGWNGFNNALSLFYSLGEFEKRHSITLVPGLNPSIEFIRAETLLLGAPYSACNHSADYTKQRCRIEHFVTTVVDQCNCYPGFDDFGAGFKGDIRSCNFFEQSTCVATIINERDEDAESSLCLPSCHDSEIHLEGTSVSQTDLVLIRSYQ